MKSRPFRENVERERKKNTPKKEIGAAGRKMERKPLIDGVNQA
jgi:hypothetical protein